MRGATLIGRGDEILFNIDMVGRDMTMGQGMCGSESGSIPANVGQPMIRISSISVGGKKLKKDRRHHGIQRSEIHIHLSAGVFSCCIFSFPGAFPTCLFFRKLGLSTLWEHWTARCMPCFFLADIFVTFLAGLMIQDHPRHKRLLLVLAAVYNFGLLFAFKYQGFICSGINSLLPRKHADTPS